MPSTTGKRRARTPSTRKKIRVIPKRRIRSVSPVKRSTRKRLAQRRPKSRVSSSRVSSTKASKSTAVGMPGKAPTIKGKKMRLDEDHKAILLRKLESQNLMSDFDLTHRYTMGSKGHEFTNLRAINLVKITKYIENDEALNDPQFWEDYDQSSLKLSIPPKRKRVLKVSDLKNPTVRENNNLYAYVLGCIQEKMAEGYFDKTDTITPEEREMMYYYLGSRLATPPSK
jgi:hypothetical protein